MRVKNKRQPFLFPIFLVFSVMLFTACSGARQQTKKEELTHQVTGYIGQINHDPEVDTLGFERCSEKQFFIYSPHSGLGYVGEKPAIVKAYNAYKPVDVKESGYITIRFMVNCTGQAGMFRVLELDSAYKPRTFSKQIVDQLLKITYGLQEWLPGEHDGTAYDYHQYLTFRIVNGNLVEILP